MQFYLSYMAMAVAVAPLIGRTDVVFATSPPLFTGVAGALVAKLKSAPFVLDVRDLWPAAALSLGQITSPTAGRAGRALEKWLYNQAAVATAVTRPFCTYIDRIRQEGRPTELIPNGTLEMFFDAETNGARERLGGDDAGFVATFAGTHGIAQGLDSILDAAALADPSDGITFAFVGDGPLRESLVEAAGRRGLTNVVFSPQVALEEMPPLLTASDALLVPLSSHPTFKTFVPSKMMDSMAAGRPVILSAAGEAARILDRPVEESRSRPRTRWLCWLRSAGCAITPPRRRPWERRDERTRGRNSGRSTPAAWRSCCSRSQARGPTALSSPHASTRSGSPLRQGERHRGTGSDCVREPGGGSHPGVADLGRHRRRVGAGRSQGLDRQSTRTPRRGSQGDREGSRGRGRRGGRRSGRASTTW